MAHPGTYVNAPTLGVTGLVTGDPDTAGTFTAASEEYVEQDDTIAAQAFTAFTMGLLLKAVSITTGVTVWGVSESGVGQIALIVDSGGDLFFAGQASGNLNAFLVPAVTTLSNGITYRIVGTWDGTTAKLFIDGSLDASAAYSDNITLDAPGKFRAGADGDPAPNTFDGTLDEPFFIPNHALTAPELAAVDAAMTGTGDLETEIVALSPYIYWRLGEASGTAAADSSAGGGGGGTGYPTLALSADFLGGTEDLTPYGREGASIARGTTSPSITGYVADAGTYSTVLDNIDRTFDPNNLSGPFVTAGETDVVPGVPVRAIINHGIDYPIFAGTADSWPQSYPLHGTDQMVDFRATDAFAFFAGAAAEITRPAEKTGARIAAVLTALGYPGATDIAPGRSFVPALNRGTAVSLSHLADVAQVEFGELYVAGDLDGTFTFRGRDEIATDARSSVSQATFVQQDPDNPYDGLQFSELALGSPPIVNEVVISYSATGQQVTLRDDASVAMPWSNGVPKSLSLSLPMMTGSQARSYARWLLLLYAYPITTFTSITLTPSNAPGATFDLWEQALTRELGDRITVTVDPLHLSATPPNRPELSGDPITRDCVIRGIQHDFALQPFSTTFYLQDQTWMDNLFIWDTSELDGPHFYGM